MNATSRVMLGSLVGVCLLTGSGFVDSTLAQVPGAKQITADERLWLQLSDEPYNHMELAREQFLQGDRSGAARSLQTAAVYLRIASQNSHKSTRSGLLEAATDLEQQAIRVKVGTLRSVGSLEQSFATAEYALALHHHASATESWSKKQTRIAGYRIQAATNAAERATKWTGHQVSDGAKAVYSGGKTLGGGLIAGTGFVVDQVGVGFESVGKQILSLGKKIAAK